ncbi:hypothetical protein PLEOSDRAFT_1111739 [Pleurotus ostreatus PC15]|uniref:Het-C-domain-containing protein n=1 Tax=Pleurotus ostreatus (strain PC15) TaxID=1137138 RepID=A0A067NW74_PLEO1|nr:hypothetical protein PLEOSDRAFT_1111739 [Pleurotus ostreatus PC15]
MPNITTTLLILTVLLVLLPPEAYAFGAGDIPDFAYLNGKAFRHGDIEGILEDLVKVAGHAGGGGLMGFAQSILQSAAGGKKFSRSDIKKVYFGNWLRDYSQAMDIAGLSKLTGETIVLIISVLGFMTFGFATEEFQVTPERLGVYLPVEHIDNPKGYAEKEGDARQFHPKLRPPVEDRELEIDERTGMKKYMASDNEGFDTSTSFIRRTLKACIENGRRAGGREGGDLWEAYRLLGTGLHTLEDLLAHSNWCEIALVKMGHREVFCHVGDSVRIRTPNGEAPPIVTGTFGGADFLHSLLGEAGDKLSQSSVTDLSAKMDSAAHDDSDDKTATLHAILSKLPIGGGDDKANQSEEMQAQAKAYNFDPDNVAPPEVQKRLLDILKWRDGVYRDVVSKIEMVPGLADLIDELTNALNAYVFTVLAPYLTPILQQTTGVLNEGSKAVIDSDDQFAVFNDDNASDPSHSMLSKDHFGLILNEPAGKIAQVVVEHTVNLIVQAWGDDSDPDQVLDQVLEAFHHPYYATGRSEIQHKMFETMEQWFGGLGPDLEGQVLEALSKESVKNGKNKRIGSDTEEIVEPGYSRESYGGAAAGHGHGGQSGGNYGGSRNDGGRYGQTGGSYRPQHHQESQEETYGSRHEGGDDSYGSRRTHGESNEGYGGSRHESSGYQPSYQRPSEEESSGGYGRHSGYGGNEEEEQPRRHHGYGGGEEEEQPRRHDYGGGGEEEEEPRRHYGYGGEEEEHSRPQRVYGGEESSSVYGRSHRGGEEESSGYGRSSHGYGGGEEETPSYGRSSHGYGGGGEEESSGYGRSHRGYGGEPQEESTGYGRHYGGREEESSGYAPSYGNSDETFGAERLNLNEESEHGYGRRHHRNEEAEEESSYGRTNYDEGY